MQVLYEKGKSKEEGIKMGTRADFYVGRGKDAEWLGSIAWDGYPEGIPKELLKTKTKASFREEIETFLKARGDGTLPKDGWPWPWEDSRTTDYAYAFDKGKVWASCYGGDWFDPLKKEPNHDDEEKVVDFPDMQDKQKVTLGERSGIILVSS